MDRIRGVAMVVGTVAVAMGAGHYMQATAPDTVVAEDIPVQATIMVPSRVAAGTPLAAYEVAEVAVTRSDTSPDTVVLPAPAPVVDEACPVTLDLFTDAEAMLSLTLTAPCRPNESVVLRHAGMSVTYQTTATGSLFVDIPALDVAGAITLRFADGSEVSAASPTSELAGMRRFALQWIEGDDFNLVTEGQVTQLGTASSAVPMYALVATLPDPATSIAIEAPVTDTNCGREALAAAFFSEGGTLAVADLTMALPVCDSAGGFVVLNNPIADMKLATAQ